ncbi:2-keto-3-deoxy-galactonokinase [Salipiger pallidus]|uniref:2-keto-3-deoxy-galactonokinase n=1 Tax=Salipiger pallidus TaxID=1775170 RepID=A0A8J2ZJY8_9RHOB|nr:2-dehydro-3-deoxygalactonokinase [Salipiger pallidus]GGG73541.1 2-keto-3-deoxy-galactonokinase [Salipiger pallidus]
MAHPDWIAAEYGHETLTLWQMAADGTVLDQGTEAHGGRALADLLPQGVPGVVSGQGPLPAPAVPAKVPGPEVAATSGALLLLQAVAQAQPVDLLGFEATRVAGFLVLNPGFDGVICLPGQTSRWVHISAGEIVSFRSFLTGGLMQSLGGLPTRGFDKAALAEAVDRAMSRPSGFAGDLAQIAAEARLAGLSSEDAAARIGGLLLGLELAAAKPYWLGQNVALVADGAFAAPWQAAIEAQGAPVVVADGPRMALEGLKQAWAARG